MTNPRTCGDRLSASALLVPYADQWIGHGDDLAAIRRIGQHLW
jgi:hypothetical protein